MKTRFIVVVGGVISAVGKGVTTASLGKIFKAYGYKTTLIKIDPYINYDAGTLRPTEHGEVWVTDDGGEIDQDLGTYERFLQEDLPKKNNITTGQIYHEVIQKERKGCYLGETVRFIPHVINEIRDRIKAAADGYEMAIIELGGTIGEHEHQQYLLALKSLEQEYGASYVTYLLVTYLPIPHHIHEMKTKPTEVAIKLLRQSGIIPHFIICRAPQEVDAIRKTKIQTYANIAKEHVISLPDVETIYEVPLVLERRKLAHYIFRHFDIPPKRLGNWSNWEQLVTNIKEPEQEINIAIVGKYVDIGDYQLADSYVSVYEALCHAGAQQHCKINITWVQSTLLHKDVQAVEQLNKFDGILVPGGFGDTGVEGKIKAIEYARLHNIPYLGLCYGMQLAVVEFARHVCLLEGAHTTEINPDTAYPVIDILPWQKELLAGHKYGGTMRLGAYSAQLKEDSLVARLYQKNWVNERHRHRYEVNPVFIDVIEQKGLCFSGYHERQDSTKLMEFIELPDHRFFVATQAHPEFTSKLGAPNPLFHGFVTAAREFAQQACNMQPYHYESPQDQRHDTQAI